MSCPEFGSQEPDFEHRSSDIESTEYFLPLPLVQMKQNSLTSINILNYLSTAVWKWKQKVTTVTFNSFVKCRGERTLGTSEELKGCHKAWGHRAWGQQRQQRPTRRPLVWKPHQLCWGIGTLFNISKLVDGLIKYIYFEGSFLLFFSCCFFWSL